MRLACIELIVHGVRRVERISHSNGFHHVITQLHEVKLYSLLSSFFHLSKVQIEAASTGIQNAVHRYGAALHISSFPGFSPWCGEGWYVCIYIEVWLCKPIYDETAALGLCRGF